MISVFEYLVWLSSLQICFYFKFLAVLYRWQRRNAETSVRFWSQRQCMRQWNVDPTSRGCDLWSCHLVQTPDRQVTKTWQSVLLEAESMQSWPKGEMCLLLAKSNSDVVEQCLKKAERIVEHSGRVWLEELRLNILNFLNKIHILNFWVGHFGLYFEKKNVIV